MSTLRKALLYCLVYSAVRSEAHERFFSTISSCPCSRNLISDCLSIWPCVSSLLYIYKYIHNIYKYKHTICMFEHIARNTTARGDVYEKEWNGISNTSVRDYFRNLRPRGYVYKIEKVYLEIYRKGFPDGRYASRRCSPLHPSRKRRVPARNRLYIPLIYIIKKKKKKPPSTGMISSSPFRAGTDSPNCLSISTITHNIRPYKHGV